MNRTGLAPQSFALRVHTFNPPSCGTTLPLKGAHNLTPMRRTYQSICWKDVLPKGIEIFWFSEGEDLLDNKHLLNGNETTHIRLERSQFAGKPDRYLR